MRPQGTVTLVVKSMGDTICVVGAGVGSTQYDGWCLLSPQSTVEGMGMSSFTHVTKLMVTPLSRYRRAGSFTQDSRSLAGYVTQQEKSQSYLCA